MNEGFNFEPVLPLDRLILDFLPPEGSMFAELMPIGETVKAMSVKVTNNLLPTSVISTRIRLLHKKGYVVPVHSTGQGTGHKSWQITPSGQQQLQEWKDAS